jgi:membrane glycosyltransferase
MSAEEFPPLTPPLQRTPMGPAAWPPRMLLWRRVCANARSTTRRWQGTGVLRRLSLLALTLGQTLAGAYCMREVLPYHGGEALEVALLAVFCVLLFWISAGFWTAIMGFVLIAGGQERFAITHDLDRHAPIAKDARTAIIMPICNEDVARVFAGLRATYESLQRAGELKHFDFFVLSDSSDSKLRAAEQDAWHALCRAVRGAGRVFYRWRRHRIKRKSGNVADFCRRWGRGYRYMVVLDADSVMSGDCLATLVRLMEAHPGAGIIQTAPRAAGRTTLFGRAQQFAASVYGPIFTAGLHFWQLGESHYWGHNAIIRVAPFMENCALGRLPGRGIFSGEIMSHDFVEAALMRRAGWGVWIAYDLEGSFEEMPPSLLDELKRDRRWCQGNLINLRLAFAEGVHPAHRVVFMTGVMAYLSAPLWALFLVLATIAAAEQTLGIPVYFMEPFQPFPRWPEWHPNWALWVSIATACVLLLPKLLAAALAAARDAKRYGGVLRLFAGVLIETVLSAVLAPIRMLFHTQFVIRALMGRTNGWKSPPRADEATTWSEAIRRHGWHTVLGLAWTAGMVWLNPSVIWWVLPLGGAIALSIPVSVWSSRVGPGRLARALKLFLIPEEVHPPRELRDTARFSAD